MTPCSIYHPGRHIPFVLDTRLGTNPLSHLLRHHLVAACSPPSHSLNPPLHYATADDCFRCPLPHASYTPNYLCVRITSDRAATYLCIALCQNCRLLALFNWFSLFAGLPAWIPPFRRLRAVFLPGAGGSDRGVTIISFSMLCTLSDHASFYTF